MTAPENLNEQDRVAQIQSQFQFLTEIGLEFKYREFQSKVDPQRFCEFSYNNPKLRRKVVFVYCPERKFPPIYGYMINYNKGTDDYTDQRNCMEFSRLRCFFNEGEGITFFGNVQYDLSNKLREFKMVLERFLKYVVTTDWIDYEDLLKHERKHYTLTLEREQYNHWIEQIKAHPVINKLTTIVYDSSVEPSYEEYGIRLRSINGIDFHITHGYASRDDIGHFVRVFQNGKLLTSEEFMNKPLDVIADYIQRMIENVSSSN